jgi:hypothetical protein
VRPLTDRHKPTDNAIFGKAVWLSLRKIKRAAKPPTSRPAFAAHFILPYRTPPPDNFQHNRQYFSLHLPRETSFDTHIQFLLVGFGCYAVQRQGRL